MQSIGNALGNMARLSYISTSSCDSYSAYHRSKAEDKIYYLRDILTPCEFDKEVDIVMERMARKAEEEAAEGPKMRRRLIKKLGTLSVVVKDVKGAMVGGGQKKLSDVSHQCWNHQVKGPVVGGGREKLSDAQHQKRAIKYGRRGITDPQHPISSQRWPEQTMIFAGLSTFYSSQQ
ncbi:hypothetical protein VE03_04095 [Pseudogymnoascus sp. 23342-1-I1]|nr:hypothetical protein VE03_04095 [Pseudogymnoascus sp. 23342-1-I1]